MIEIISKREIAERQQESKEEKSIRLQMLLQHMIGEAVRESSRELCEDIKQSVLKEMDYQFRQQEEREELKRQEEYREKMARIDQCLHCGQCAGRCPYGLDTPELLRRNYEDYKTFLK